jgi:hypothetical protein
MFGVLESTGCHEWRHRSQVQIMTFRVLIAIIYLRGKLCALPATRVKGGCGSASGLRSRAAHWHIRTSCEFDPKAEARCF